MSIRDSRQTPLRDRWPLEFDLEGIPRDTQTRERLLADLRQEHQNPEIYPMNVPQVKNSFATDNDPLLSSLTAAQKQTLLKALLADNPGGQEFDLSKPPVAPYRYQEYPKCMYSADGKQVVNARDAEHEKELAKRKFSAKPPAKKQDDTQGEEVA